MCILAVFFRFRLICAGLHLFSLGLGGAAFLALAAQMIIGFPIEKYVKQQFEKARVEQERRNGQVGIRPIQGAEGFEALFDIDSHYSVWLWLSCLLAFISGAGVSAGVLSRHCFGGARAYLPPGNPWRAWVPASGHVIASVGAWAPRSAAILRKR